MASVASLLLTPEILSAAFRRVRREQLREIIKKLVTCGHENQVEARLQRLMEFKMDWRSEKFSPLPLKFEDVFLGSKEAWNF